MGDWRYGWGQDLGYGCGGGVWDVVFLDLEMWVLCPLPNMKLEFRVLMKQLRQDSLL